MKLNTESEIQFKRVTKIRVLYRLNLVRGGGVFTGREDVDAALRPEAARKAWVSAMEG